MIDRIPWSRHQIAVVRTHWRLPVSELKLRVDACGPARSVDAITERRRQMGLLKDRRGNAAPARIIEQARAAEVDRRDGWPVMRGTPEERERRYLQALYEGLRATEGDSSKREDAA